MTTAEQLQHGLFVLHGKISQEQDDGSLLGIVESLMRQVAASLEQGDQIWVVETEHRLTTQLQIVNAIAQGYKLKVVAFDSWTLSASELVA